MRGHGESNGSLWYSLDLEELVGRDHPLRAIKRMVDDALRGMDADFRRASPRARAAAQRGLLAEPAEAQDRRGILRLVEDGGRPAEVAAPRDEIGRWKIAQQVELTAAAYNLVRMRRLLAA